MTPKSPTSSYVGHVGAPTCCLQTAQDELSMESDKEKYVICLCKAQ